MKNAYLYKSSLVIKIALATAILLIAYITVVFFNQMTTLGDSVTRMSNSNRKLIAMEELLTILSVNETSVRSFIITRDSSYIKRFRTETDAKRIVASLQTLDAEHKSRSLSVLTLDKMLRDRFKLFGNVTDYVMLNESPRNLNYMLTTGDIASDQIRNYLNHAMKDEADNVHKYEIEHRHKIETSILTSFFLVTVALFILLLSLNRINSDLLNLKKLNDDLRFLNFTFNSAEKIAGISHWKYNLQTQRFAFSDNLYNLLGIIPSEDQSVTIGEIIDKIHPEDRDRVMATYNDSLVQKVPTSLIFRIFAANGEIRYIRSVGSLAENSRGEIVKIAVNYDITDQYEKTLELEENNRNLIAINAELEAFNTIVSHDLQEPLRKIQMFISRIDSDQAENLSEKGRDYFSRVRVAANRMQNLLIDLVNYSRTIKGERKYEDCDLSAIVDEVKHGLSTQIEDIGAVVKCQKLPVIQAIPFQMQQLFVNLVSNSLKFSRDGVVPEINIKSIAINDSDFINGAPVDPVKYVKIVVSDNGIGFKQELSEKIFHLFRRLENGDGHGTGIGLAICRKIAENHGGSILATGKVDKGARFTIFLLKKPIVSSLKA